MQIQSLDQEDHADEEIANHSSILTKIIPWREEPSGLWPMGNKESDMNELACMNTSTCMRTCAPTPPPTHTQWNIAQP